MGVGEGCGGGGGRGGGLHGGELGGEPFVVEDKHFAEVSVNVYSFIYQ